MTSPFLQLALDFSDLDNALRVASPFVDTMEAGAPLIKSIGLDAVRRLAVADVPGLVRYPRVRSILAGSAITRARDPARVAAAFRETLDSL